MISIEQYRDKLLACVEPLPSECVSLAQASSRVLADDVVARVPNPVFDNSAMDGFAIRVADIRAGCTVSVDGDNPAGMGAGAALAPGAARRIMTGAPIPEGADAVVPVELTDQPRGVAPISQQVRIDEVPHVGRHIRRRGEDVAAGDTVVEAGTRLTSTTLAAVASVGVAQVVVSRRPRVAIVATGDEIVPAGEILAPGQIPDSNTTLLRSLIIDVGAELVAVRRCSDQPADFVGVVERLATEVDVIITTGGVSAGAYDVVVASGIDLESHQVAMQPGKPQAFGRVGNALLVGLPGNPVSVFVSFRVFVLPVLERLVGSVAKVLRVRATAVEGWKSPAGRRQFAPVELEFDGEELLAKLPHSLGAGSHLIASLHRADGLAVIGEDVTWVAPGSNVMVEVTRCPN